MSADRDDRNDDVEPDRYDEEPPRSIFAATWFRAVLVLIVLGVIGAVAVPYILDAVNPPPTQQAVVKSAPLPATPPTPPPSPSPAPAAPVASAPTDGPSLPSSQRPTSASAAGSETTQSAAPARKPSAPLAKSEVPPTKPAAPPAKTEPVAPKTNGPAAKSSMSTSPAASGDSSPKTTAAEPPTKPAARKPSQPRQAATSAATGVYWVQVGAFKDEETAKRLAARLREQNFKVAHVTASTPSPAASAATPSASSSATPAGSDQYDVFVTGLPPAELNTRLAAKGLASETSGAGVVVKPSLPLRDAVALSKDLAVDGLKVQVRRAGSAGAAARPQAAKPPPAADGLYRVRVGSFNDRAAAVAALRELEAKGYRPFIARGER
jgi:cell division protein FtsN